ncbi:TetR/AcrR family transcriptional regulator [Pseudonocardia abyssalis]|uniref:Helix-turn-helix transcriptional regulator n=1 Tax=Pseudonocardia abyssalis TaxID=2792008 RepID=A0ABS6UTI4_9PSEU|nr:TetR/AcrR family transcriptional regulator [Pseudonocardia abyssalis]MBW0117504.1 helix-turn-helix transcriptional regulator [Pseudonocardia abyssalis]MBW0135266.1 helix-turn-helix transcriptional regulator [Pseudonocardia abyssalis]
MTTAPRPRDPAPRPRDSAATRAALLAAARELFAERGYDGTTVRGVADRAGVNQALLFRYFGNKEALFAEAVSEQALAPLVEGPPETLLERMLTTMFDDTRGSAMFFAVLSSEGRAGEAVRTELGAAYRSAFAALAATDDPVDADLRATLLLAWLLGLGQARPEIAGGEKALVAHVLRGARALLSG